MHSSSISEYAVGFRIARHPEHNVDVIHQDRDRINAPAAIAGRLVKLRKQRDGLIDGQ